MNRRQLIQRIAGLFAGLPLAGKALADSEPLKVDLFKMANLDGSESYVGKSKWQVTCTFYRHPLRVHRTWYVGAKQLTLADAMELAGPEDTIVVPDGYTEAMSSEVIA
jgi:hypothetical protein